MPPLPPEPEPLRLGFAVKVMGDAEIKSNDTRRWQSGPHLKTSLEYLQTLFGHLEKHRIHMYRFSSDLAPYHTHPDMPQFHGQLAESAAELRALGARARELRLRISFHPSQYIVMNSPDPELVRKSMRDLVAQAEMLDRMEAGPEAVMVIHVGGVYGEREAARARWIAAYKAAPEPVRRRLVLENDDISFSCSDVLLIHEACGVPLIFDHQHFWCLNPADLEMRPTLERFLRTWPRGVRPKIHFSSPRTELREVKRRDRKTKKIVKKLEKPLWTNHADYNNPFEFASFMRTMAGLEFDVMLEAKRKDLALIRLRGDLARYAPDVAIRFGCAHEDEAKVEALLEAAEEQLAAAGVDGEDG